MQMNAIAQLGLGAGIFGGQGVLGQTEEPLFVYPWGVHSDSTLSLQYATNYELGLREMPLVTEDGILGAETCGAQSYLIGQGLNEHDVALRVADCRAFAYPPTAAPTTPPPSLPTPKSPTYSGTQKSGMGLGWLLIAGGVATAGVYLATRKKR